MVPCLEVSPPHLQGNLGGQADHGAHRFVQVLAPEVHVSPTAILSLSRIGAYLFSQTGELFPTSLSEVFTILSAEILTQHSVLFSTLEPLHLAQSG